MKQKILLFSVLLFSTFAVIAQNTTYPKWITEKSSKMANQVKIDLKLTDDEADKYKQIIMDKFSTDASTIKTLEGDDAKKEYRTKSSVAFGTKLKETFGEEKASSIQKWTAENMPKFNKPQNQ